MADLTPIFADERKAAALLSMKLADFRALVEAGHLPRGVEIAPGLVRWRTEDLNRIGRGDAAEGLGDVQW